MSWRDYYYLFEKYDGDLTRATGEELDCARRGNPNTPEDARRLAQQEWARKCVHKALAIPGLRVHLIEPEAPPRKRRLPWGSS